MTNRFFASVLVLGLMLAPVIACAQEQAAQGKPATPTKEVPQTSARRSIGTMMFSLDDYNDIQSRIVSVGSADGKREDTEIESADLYLSTILYTSGNEWVAWINGVPVTPNQVFQSFQVTSITPRYIELLVPLSAQGMRPVKLGQNQTFIAKTGAVVEGPLR